MVDLLLKLIDRLIELKNYRVKRAENAFNDIVQPTFDELLLVHSDYIKMFDEVHARVGDVLQSDRAEQAKTVSEAINYLRKRRLEFEPIREKLQTIIKESDSLAVSPEISVFVSAVGEYFPDGKLYTLPSAASTVLSQLRHIELRLLEVDAPDATEMPLDYLFQCIALTIFDRRAKWAEVCEAFAKCKVGLAVTKQV